jgi:hypothetical protein
VSRTLAVPNIRVRGQLTFLEVEKENKKKDCNLYMYCILPLMPNICRSVKTYVIVVGGLECVMYEQLEQTSC